MEARGVGGGGGFMWRALLNHWQRALGKKKAVNRGGMVELFKQPKRAAIKPLGAKAGGCCNGTKS